MKYRHALLTVTADKLVALSNALRDDNFTIESTNIIGMAKASQLDVNQQAIPVYAVLVSLMMPNETADDHINERIVEATRGIM